MPGGEVRKVKAGAVVGHNLVRVGSHHNQVPPRQQQLLFGGVALDQYAVDGVARAQHLHDFQARVFVTVPPERGAYKGAGVSLIFRFGERTVVGALHFDINGGYEQWCQLVYRHMFHISKAACCLDLRNSNTVLQRNLFVHVDLGPTRGCQTVRRQELFRRLHLGF